MITRTQPSSFALFLVALLITSLQALAQVSSSPASASKPGTISGRVINESGRPLPNAGILLRRVGSRYTEPTTTTTDREGKFQLSGLEPVSYQGFAFLRGSPPLLSRLCTHPRLLLVWHSLTL